MRILKADYIFPINGDPIPNGYLFIEDDGTIIHTTSIAPITDQFEIESYEGVLCPGFVNTHCHLELSHLKDKLEEHTGLPNFIRDVQKHRNVEKAIVLEAIKSADEIMQKEGIVAVGDISNGSDTFECKSKSPIKYHTFLEVFGSDPQDSDHHFIRAQDLQKQLEKHQLSSSIVPHAPYSVSEKLFKKLGEHCYVDESPICIHNQETSSENTMFSEGSGALLEQLKQFSPLYKNWKGTGQRSLMSRLVLLPRCNKIALVHNTFSNEDDIDKALKYHDYLWWCTCPNANLYIENRLPNYTLWREKNLRICIGTDSLASNHNLSIIEELKSIQKHQPEISLNELLLWASYNGAALLGYDKSLGSFDTGKKPGINLIKNVDLEQMQLTDTSYVEHIPTTSY